MPVISEFNRALLLYKFIADAVTFSLIICFKHASVLSFNVCAYYDDYKIN